MNKIILYSTKCPRCLMLEKKLEQHGIDFEEITDTNVMIEKGFTTVPMLEVDGQIMDYNESIKWIMEATNEK